MRSVSHEYSWLLSLPVTCDVTQCDEKTSQYQGAMGGHCIHKLEKCPQKTLESETQSDKCNQNTYCFTFPKLLLSTIKVKIDIKTFQELSDGVLICVRLLLYNFHKVLEYCSSTFVGDNSCC